LDPKKNCRVGALVSKQKEAYGQEKPGHKKDLIIWNRRTMQKSLVFLGGDPGQTYWDQKKNQKDKAGQTDPNSQTFGLSSFKLARGMHILLVQGSRFTVYSYLSCEE
jgi:hypothetical protein